MSRAYCPFHTSADTCDCLGSDGKPKRNYPTEEEASASADYIESRGGPRLRVYACPWSSGYHLTKS